MNEDLKDGASAGTVRTSFEANSVQPVRTGHQEAIYASRRAEEEYRYMTNRANDASVLLSATLDLMQCRDVEPMRHALFLANHLRAIEKFLGRAQ